VSVSADELAGLPQHVQRLVAHAGQLPLQHRHGEPSETARRSAVLILFGEGRAGPDVLLIEKSAHLRSHAGQPAFPGGGADPGEDYPVGTALREAQEEVGVDPASVRVVATLPELFLGPSDNVVVPVVGWWDDPREIETADPREVARVARVPLASLVDPANRFRVRHPSGYVGPAFGVAGMVVWGFTAGLLDAVLEAAGLSRPWNARDVRPLAVPPPVPAGAGAPADEPVDSDVADRAAPTVADDAGHSGSPRTVPGS
jgi:8-oxo-dGTP pyrophosphatase MutT (NUDIX family)